MPFKLHTADYKSGNREGDNFIRIVTISPVKQYSKFLKKSKQF
jgi:hypothetical protein